MRRRWMHGMLLPKEKVRLGTCHSNCCGTHVWAILGRSYADKRVKMDLLAYDTYGTRVK